MPRKWEWHRFDELPLVLDEDQPMMRRERGHDILPFQFSADEVFGTIKLDSTLAIDFANPRHMTLGDGKSQMTADVDIGLEREAVWEMLEGRPGPLAEDSGEPGPMLNHRKASAGLLDVIVAQEAVTRPTQGPKVGAMVKKDALLPEAVKAFHGSVAPRLSRRDEEKTDAQEEMEPDDLGEAVTIPAPSGCRHLVVHLGDLRQAHNAPGINEMAAKRERLLVLELAGRGRLSDDIDGVEGIKAGDAAQPPQIARPNQIGLLDVAHPASLDAGIRGSAGKPVALDLFRLAGPGQDLFDGRDGGKLTAAPSLELEMDRFGADAGEGRSPALMGRQFVAESQDLTYNGPGCPTRDMYGNSASVPKPVEAKKPVSLRPLGQPPSTSVDRLECTTKSTRLFVHSNGLETDLIFPALFHRFRLLPNDLGRSLGDGQNGSRCPYGFLVYDVLTETPYALAMAIERRWFFAAVEFLVLKKRAGLRVGREKPVRRRSGHGS